MEIRPATTDDLENVLRLRMALLHEEAKSTVAGRLRPDAGERARSLFTAELSSDRGITLLAFDRGEAIGILRCTISRASELVVPGRHAYLSWAWVEPPHRRRAVLRSLVAAAEAWSRERGVGEMRLRVNVDNPLGNAAWDALGFTPAELVRRRAITGG